MNKIQVGGNGRQSGHIYCQREGQWKKNNKTEEDSADKLVKHTEGVLGSSEADLRLDANS